MNQVGFERLLSVLSAGLLAERPEVVHKAIVTAQKRIVRALDLDRSTVWVLRPDGDLELSHQFSRPGVVLAPRLLARQVLPWCFNEIMSGRRIVFSSLNELPPEAESDRAIFRELGPNASVVFPLLVGGSVFGAIGFGVVRGERAWSRPVLRRLKLFSHVIASALQRRESHEALRASEERKNLALASAAMGLWEWDLRSDSVWISPQLATLLGLEIQSSISLENFLGAIHEDDRDGVGIALRNALTERTDCRIEYRVLRPDGEVRWAASLGRGHVQGDGEGILRMLGVTYDITDLIRAQSGEQHARAELAHVTRVATVSELAGSLAHELNQPLTAILTNAQAAQRFLATDVAEVSASLADIVEDAKRAGEVIRRMRGLIRKGTPEISFVDAGRVATEVLVLVRGDAQRRGATIRTRSQPLPPVVADRVQLQQVMLNLLINALDGFDAAAVEDPRVMIEFALEGDDRARISVRDNGPGLNEATLEGMFLPFYTTKPNGLGMGLSICRSIVEAHGGKIGAENNATGGATVWFTLPLSRG